MGADGAGRGYRPIGDYALIGDAHAAALVASDGSIDWLCWPHMDSPSVFGRLLDARRGGWFCVGPTGEHDVARAYLPDTNVLTTTWRAGGAAVRLTDFMPARRRTPDAAGEDLEPSCQVARLVEGLAGELELAVEFAPAFDYARAETAIVAQPSGAVARAHGETLTLQGPITWEHDTGGALRGRLRVGAGQRLWLTLDYRGVADAPQPDLSGSAAEEALATTAAYWRDWSAACTYGGPYHNQVRRSALALKLLTFAPTGALVAAPTTS